MSDDGILFAITIQYTNASNKENKQFVVYADDEVDATRVMFGSGAVGTDMSTMHISRSQSILLLSDKAGMPYSG